MPCRDQHWEEALEGSGLWVGSSELEVQYVSELVEQGCLNCVPFVLCYIRLTAPAQEGDENGEEAFKFRKTFFLVC